ncbi:MAG: undecaprenyl-phosphate glucose phosphotransferase [Lachnospiraceae bacterium]|nr:undecaprenyl-phosphate glucose phosphotransferase [Lachnospiraceae bacterium]
MIRDNQHKVNILRVILDLITIVAAYFLTMLLFFHVFPPDSSLGGVFSAEVPREEYVMAILYIAPLHLIIYWIHRLYRYMRVTGRRHEAFVIFRANLIAVLIIVMVFYLFVKSYAVHFSRVFLAEFGVINTLAVILMRNLMRLVVISFRKKGYNRRTVLLVGQSKGAAGFLERVRSNPQWGYVIYGILDDELPAGSEYEGIPVLGPVTKLAEILSKNEVDEVMVTLKLSEYDFLPEVVSVSEKAGMQTKFVPDYGNLMSAHPYTEDLVGLPVVYIRNVPLEEPFNSFLKRTVDIIGSLFALIVFSPVMLVTAICVKLSSPGPVIFRQERVGLHNKNFVMYKFRSMGVQKKEAEAKEWTTKNDPRVTGIGKLIRKTSIDELPQFYNVLKGDMSMVGPRPERPQFVEQFKEEIPRYMIKHQVRPGMTGWAQVNGLRGDTSIEARIDYDIYYIENWTLSLDFKILFLTFFKGFMNKNAY